MYIAYYGSQWDLHIMKKRQGKSVVKGKGVVLKTVVIITDIEVMHLDIDVAFVYNTIQV